jgi:hypothetical protein
VGGRLSESEEVAVERMEFEDPVASVRSVIEAVRAECQRVCAERDGELRKRMAAEVELVGLRQRAGGGPQEVVDQAAPEDASLMSPPAWAQQIVWGATPESLDRVWDGTAEDSDAELTICWFRHDGTQIGREETQDGCSAAGTGFLGDGALVRLVVWRGVARIGVGAFSNCTGLTSVEFALDAALEEIGERSFVQCRSLERLKVPSSVVRIGGRAFDGCVALKSVTIADSSKLEELGDRSFADCAELENFNVLRVSPESVSALSVVVSTCGPLHSLPILLCMRSAVAHSINVRLWSGWMCRRASRRSGAEHSMGAQRSRL